MFGIPAQNHVPFSGAYQCLPSASWYHQPEWCRVREDDGSDLMLPLQNQKYFVKKSMYYVYQVQLKYHYVAQQYNYVD